jgi:hypothetical protein
LGAFQYLEVKRMRKETAKENQDKSVKWKNQDNEV